MTAPENPLLISARREAVVVLLMWLTTGVYSVGYCAWFGYGRTTADLHFVLGFPDWIFWGVVVPWVTCAVISLVISNFYMTDEDMGADHDAETEANRV